MRLGGQAEILPVRQRIGQRPQLAIGERPLTQRWPDGPLRGSHRPVIDVHPPPQPCRRLQNGRVGGRVKVHFHKVHRIVVESKRGQLLQRRGGSIIPEAHRGRRALQRGLSCSGQLPGAPAVERHRVEAGYVEQQSARIDASAGPDLRSPIQVGGRPGCRRKSCRRIQELSLGVAEAPLPEHQPPQPPSRFVRSGRLRVSLRREPEPRLSSRQVAVNFGECCQRHHRPGRPGRLHLFGSQPAPDGHRFPVAVVIGQGAAKPVERPWPVRAGDACRLLERIRCSTGPQAEDPKAKPGICGDVRRQGLMQGIGELAFCGRELPRGRQATRALEPRVCRRDGQPLGLQAEQPLVCGVSSRRVWHTPPRHRVRSDGERAVPRVLRRLAKQRPGPRIRCIVERACQETREGDDRFLGLAGVDQGIRVDQPGATGHR